MKYKVNTNEMFFEINLWEFISNYNKVNTKIDKISWTIKTKESLNAHINQVTNLLSSSVIKINKRKSKNSLAIVKMFWKVIHKKDWFYLNFSAVNNNKRYTYTIKLLSNLTYSTSWFLAWKSFSINIQDLENSAINTSINFWIRNPIITNLWINISFNWLMIFWIIAWSLIYSVTQAFSNFI